MAHPPDTRDLDFDLAACFASYEVHRFCIRLPPEASLLDESGAQRSHLDANTLAVVVHEYTHFTHNVSTVSGWTAYELFLQLLACFSQAFDQGSAPSSRLGEASEASLCGCGPQTPRRHGAHRGSPGHPDSGPQRSLGNHKAGWLSGAY